MSHIATVLLYELQKKYPTAEIAKDDNRVIRILHRNKAAVTLTCYCGAYSNGALYSHAHISFTYHGKERDRENTISLRDIVDPQDVLLAEEGKEPRKVYGIVLDPAVINQIAAACRKKIALLYKRAVEKIESEYLSAERARTRVREFADNVKARVGERVDVVPAGTGYGTAVKVTYRNFSEIVYPGHDHVKIKVPLERLADTVDFVNRLAGAA